MELFTMKYEHKKHRMALDAVLAEHGGPEIRMACVAYRKNETTGEVWPSGLALEGVVPVKNLIRWATRKGFLKWQRAEAVPSVPVPEPTETAPEPEVPKVKTRKVSKPTAKKTTKTTKEKKHARTGRVVNRRGAKSVSAASSGR
jgi:hypothetical protein